MVSIFLMRATQRGCIHGVAAVPLLYGVLFTLYEACVTQHALTIFAFADADVLNLMRCLVGELSFASMYAEAVVRGNVKEFQEAAAKCYTVCVCLFGAFLWLLLC